MSWAFLALLLLLFPDGRLPSRRWRPAAWAAGVVLVGSALSAPFLPGLVAPGQPANPLGIEPLGGVLRLIYGAATVVLAAVLLAAVVSLVARFRRATGAERQQLKWFAYGTALPLLLAFRYQGLIGNQDLVAQVVDVVWFPVLVSGIPVAIELAVLKYRLYDIDRIISRTLVYALLTALLGVVLVLGHLFGGIGAKPPSWAVAGATLAVAALFQPARRRIQQVVDRRFNPGSTTRPRRSMRSAPGCGTSSTWTPCRPSC